MVVGSGGDAGVPPVEALLVEPPPDAVAVEPPLPVVPPQPASNSATKTTPVFFAVAADETFSIEVIVILFLSLWIRYYSRAILTFWRADRLCYFTVRLPGFAGGALSKPPPLPSVSRNRIVSCEVSFTNAYTPDFGE